MANPVGGHTNPPPPNPDQPPRDSISERIDFVANEIFSRFPQAEPSPLPSQASAGEVRLSKEEILQQWVESQPRNAKAEAQQILAILRQKNLDNPFELELGNLKNITSLPNVLQNCTKLSCEGCTSLQALPELPVCTRLICMDCTSLQALPALPVCDILNCSTCTSLQALPELPECVELGCNCTSLQALPELPVCRRLFCLNCTSLQTLPELPVCIWLGCDNCTSIQTLPALPVCKRLDCPGCTSLQTLPELPVCKRLECHGCTSLQTLPELPECRTLDCRGCTSLQALPALPVCESLDCYNCPLLPPQVQQPDLPQVQQSNPYQGRIDRAAQGTLQDALSFWSSLLPQGQAQLLSAEDLQLSEADQRLFQIFLNRLQETADFRQANPQNFALRVASIVRDMATSKEFREKAIMALGEANESCGDRVAIGINNLELLSLMYGENKPKTDVDTACLAIRLARLDLVRKKAMELNRGAEGLETVLFLELRLKDRLQLPLQTKGMLYTAIGAVKDQVVERTAEEILAATSTDKQLVDILVNSSVWTDFLQRKYAFFYADVLEGLEIIANLAEGTDYQASLVELQQKPTDAWTNFLKNVGPPDTSPEKREALQREVLQAFKEACPSLTGTEYSAALRQLIQQIHRKKTIEWLTANGNALRARLNP